MTIDFWAHIKDFINEENGECSKKLIIWILAKSLEISIAFYKDKAPKTFFRSNRRSMLFSFPLLYLPLSLCMV
jgi:hypothetical protein